MKDLCSLPMLTFFCLATTSCEAAPDSLNFADMLRGPDATPELLDPRYDEFLSDPALTAVTREFGPTVIGARSLPFRSAVAVSEIKPWSSWWYPKREGGLIEPLAKYDYLRQTRARLAGQPGSVGSARDFEMQSNGANALAWEGLCDAWALASISKPEPKRPVTITVGNSTVTFGIDDLKALLLKTYDAVDDSSIKMYGQRFNGSYTGWIYPDIYPEQFHRFMEVQLFDRGLPFLMDHDPGVEVWTVPIFKANYVLEEVPGKPDSVLVHTWVHTAESTKREEKDFVGTKSVVREYDYILQGVRNANGDLVIQSGYWIKTPGGVDSRNDHPDYVLQVQHPESLVRKSWNPQIDMALIDEILEKSY